MTRFRELFAAQNVQTEAFAAGIWPTQDCQRKAQLRIALHSRADLAYDRKVGTKKRFKEPI